MTRWWKGPGAFVLTVAFVVAVFAATTALVLVRSHAISHAAHGITSNAVPSLEALLATRSEAALLRIRLERTVGRHTFDPGAHDRVWETAGHLRRHLDLYVTLPTYDGERQLQQELLASVDALTGTIRRVLALRSAGDLTGARDLFESELVPGFEEMDRLVARAEQINTGEVKAFTEQMEALREASSRDALLLNALCVVLAVVLVTWAVVGARRQRALEESYARALRERADEMEVFASRVAHDILSPLSAASLSLQRLARSSDDEVSQVAKHGLSGVRSVADTVDGLLDFARAGARPPEGAASIAADVARDVVTGLQEHATAAGATLELVIEGCPAEIPMSRGVLTSVLTNLVQNGIKYLHGASMKRVSVTIRARDGHVRVEVQDTGPGVPPELSHRVFEPYFRGDGSATAGIGLGLATVKRLVLAHHGSVGVDSAPGQGATFWFEVPARLPP